MLRYALTARRDRNHTGGSYWSATPVLFPNFYNAVLTSGYRKDNISVMHNDRFRGSLVDFQRQRSSQLTGGDFGWPGGVDGKGQAIRAYFIVSYHDPGVVFKANYTVAFHGGAIGTNGDIVAMIVPRVI